MSSDAKGAFSQQIFHGLYFLSQDSQGTNRPNLSRAMCRTVSSFGSNFLIELAGICGSARLFIFFTISTNLIVTGQEEGVKNLQQPKLD